MPDSTDASQPAPSAERRRTPAAPDVATPTDPAPATPAADAARQRTEQLRDDVAGKTLLATVYPCTTYTIPGDAEDGSGDLVITLDGTPVPEGDVDGIVEHAARQDVQLVHVQP